MKGTFFKRIITFALVSCAVLATVVAKTDVDKSVIAKYANPNTRSSDNWGALNCHDPKIFQDDDGTYYVYSTDASIGGTGEKGIQVRSSKDLITWAFQPHSAIQRKWDREWLKWVSLNMANASSWAPTVIKQNGLYYMMHGIITDNRNHGYPDAAITLAISTTPTGPFYPAAQAAKKDEAIAVALTKLNVSYTQSNIVRYTYFDRSFDETDPSIADQYCNNLANYDTHNAEEADISSLSYGFGAIDPDFVTDVSTGKLVTFTIGNRACYGLTYGSWKGGIALMYVDAVSLKPVDPAGNEVDAPADTVEGTFGVAIAGGFGAAYEGAQVIFNSENGYYYCFVSMGSLDYDYRVGVGRSKNVTGPYLDASGKSMYLDPMNSTDYHEIGSKIMGAEVLNGEYGWRCPGGESIIRTQDGIVIFVCHARTNYLPGYFFFLQVRQMFFTKEGWPVLNHNEYYNDYNGKDEKLTSLKAADVAGTYDAILSVRGATIGKFKPFGSNDPVEASMEDAESTKSKDMTLNADGTIGGSYAGTWTLASDGYTVSLELKNTDGSAVGTFQGYALKAVDWARKKGTHYTITFTTIDSTKTGEYFWGNKR